MEIITIPSVDFHEMLEASPRLMRSLLGDYAARIANFTALVDRLTSRDLDAELASLPHQFLRSVGAGRHVPPSDCR